MNTWIWTGNPVAQGKNSAKNKQDSLLIYQAHLPQTRYVDLVLGEILDELEFLICSQIR
jgi:hypothetical protein